MPQNSKSAASWDAVAAELRAYRDQQKQTWGDLDHALLGRFLAGEVTSQERALVEAELADHPELLILTEVVSGVLADVDPVRTSTEQPKILSFPSVRKPGKVRQTRYRQLASLAAAASLLLGMGFVLNQSETRSTNPDDSFATGMELTAGPRGGGGFAPMAVRGKPHQTFFHDAAPELVARADDHLNRDEIDKAAEMLFVRKKDGADPVRLHMAPPALVREPGKTSDAPVADAKPYIRTVAKMADKVLDRSQAESAFAPIAADDKRANRRQWILENSLPPLLAGISQNDDTKLQCECVQTLGRMGTTAREVAAEKLYELSQRGKGDVQNFAKNAYRNVARPDWIGVRDEAGVLSDEARDSINAQLTDLSRTYNVVIVAETVATMPESDRKQYAAYSDLHKKAALNAMARTRCKEVGADRAMFLYICMDPPAVQIAVAPEIQRKAGQKWKQAAAEERLIKGVQQKQVDHGLQDVVKMIRSAVAK